MSAFARARRRARSRRLGTVLLLLALAGAVCAAPARGAGTANKRVAHVSPATGLSDQVARVTWSGFRPTLSDGTFGVVVLQCRLHPKSVQKDCNPQEPFPQSLTGNRAAGVTQKNSTGAAFIDIQSTARYPALACSHTNPCSLLLYEITPDGFDDTKLPAAYTTVRLEFRQNAADCPPPEQFDVRFEAEASAAAALYQWATDLCTGTKPLQLDVTNTSSTAARKQFFLKHVDVGVSSVPPEPGEATAGAPKFAPAPLDLTALVVAYHIVDPVTRHQITDVTLTPRLVARIISDSDVLTLFQDPEFKRLNPRHTFPLATAEPLVRADQNADTWILTNWLNSDPSAREFLDGKDPFHMLVNEAWKGIKYPTEIFEARFPSGAYLPRTGEEDVAQRLFHSTKPSEGVSSSPADYGFFAVLDLPIARRFALPIAKLTKGVGKPVVSLDDESVRAGYEAMTTTTDGFHVVSSAPADPKAWPLTKVDHALVPTDRSDPARAVSIQAFLRYAAGPGQATLPPGFVALPPALADQTTLVAAALEPPPPPVTTGTVAPFTTSEVPPPVATVSSGSATEPSAAPAVAPSTPKSAKVVAKATVIQPVLAVSPAGGERFALPLLLLLGFGALTFAAVDGASRTVRSRRKP